MHSTRTTSIWQSIGAMELELLARDALQLFHSGETARLEALFTVDAHLRSAAGAVFDGRAAVARALGRHSQFRQRRTVLRGVVVLEPFVLLQFSSTAGCPDGSDSRMTPFAVLEVCDGAIASWIEDRA